MIYDIPEPCPKCGRLNINNCALPDAPEHVCGECFRRHHQPVINPVRLRADIRQALERYGIAVGASNAEYPPRYRVTLDGHHYLLSGEQCLKLAQRVARLDRSN